MKEAPRPFRFALPVEATTDLIARFQRTRWPVAVQDDGWESGTDIQFMRRLADYWTEAFDWSAMERRVNALPQFQVEIDGITIHFAHIRGKGKRGPGLIMTHGWPGSFLEMERIVPMLTEPARYGFDDSSAFDLVVPSLPGFGFSSAPTQVGVNTRVIAQMWHKLMSILGYKQYFVQGGDIGAGVSSWLARLYPEHVLGIHLNFIPASYQPFSGEGSVPLSTVEREWLLTRQRWLDDEGAYSHVQATRPQTLAYAVTDSPIGLAAWLIEKYRAWSDCGGDVLTRFSMDELLTNAALYWFSGSVGSTLRIYKENRGSALRLDQGERIRPALSFASFPKEICPPPREWVSRGYTVSRWTEMPSGGHFAAMEEPHLLAQDIHDGFRDLR